MSERPPRLLDRLLLLRPGGSAAIWIALVIGLTARAAWLRAPAWNPPSLFFDDQWVGIVATRMTVSDYLALRPPVPAGFALLLASLARLFADPEWPLQLLPTACSVALVPLTGWTLHRLTGRPALGLLAAAMVVVDPRLATFGVRVKPYALDALLAVGLVLLATWVARAPDRSRHGVLAAAAVMAALLSFPALFVGGALVGAFLLLGLRAGRDRARASLLATLVFTAGGGLVYVLLLRGAARLPLSVYWRSYLLPTGDAGEAARFLLTRGVGFLTGPFPRSLEWLCLLVPVGLSILLWRRATRWLGVAILLLGIEVVAASALGGYPIGGARTDMYAHGILIILVCCALLPLFSARVSRWSGAVLAVAALALVLSSAKPSRYPPRRDAELVRRAHATLGPDDTLLLFPAAGIAAGYYWPGEVLLLPAARPCGFTTVVRHALSETLDRGRGRGPSATLARLRRLLRAEPPRIVYLATNISGRAHQRIRDTILAAGYEVDGRQRGPVAALTIFRRVGPDPASSP